MYEIIREKWDYMEEEQGCIIYISVQYGNGGGLCFLHSLIQCIHEVLLFPILKNIKTDKVKSLLLRSLYCDRKAGAQTCLHNRRQRGVSDKGKGARA